MTEQIAKPQVFSHEPDDQVIDHFLLPAKENKAAEAGQKYFDEWLKPVLPGLLEIVEKIQRRKEILPEETSMIFLDRDARPAMYAWHELQPKTQTFPVPLSSIQLHAFRKFYSDFERANLGDIHQPDEWSTKLAEELDSFLDYYPQPQNWIKAFRRNYQQKFDRAKTTFVVDIGYRGSAVEMAKYVLGKAFPGKSISTILLYKYSDDIPIRAVKSDATTWGAEMSTPQTVSGYELQANGAFKYMREHNQNASFATERSFYQGVITAAKAAYATK